MKKQATRANEAQIKQHIKRQKAGISGMEFAQRHPVLDAALGAIVIVLSFGCMIAAWVYVGAGLSLAP